MLAAREAVAAKEPRAVLAQNHRHPHQHVCRGLFRRHGYRVSPDAMDRGVECGNQQEGKAERAVCHQHGRLVSWSPRGYTTVCVC